jgi:chorismate-pyruvate lyase
MERLVREAGLGIEELKQSPDLSEKDMKKVVELEEKNSILAGTVESLTRQLDVAREQNNRSIETSEEMRIYQPLIAKLEKEPQLLLFAKYY